MGVHDVKQSPFGSSSNYPISNFHSGEPRTDLRRGSNEEGDLQGKLLKKTTEF